MLCCAADLGAGRVAFLDVRPTGAQAGPEGQAAAEWARAQGAQLIRPADAGFVDPQDRPVSLERFQVIWYHQGDSTNLVSGGAIASLKKFVESGHGLFLSGSALALVQPLGIEPVRPRVITGRSEKGALTFHTLEEHHPIFRGLLEGFPWDETVGGFVREFDLPFEQANLSTYADFVGSGGPRGGKSLGWLDEANANPLVEYELGKGRVLVLGGRLATYSKGAGSRGATLERFTTNILAYLGDAGQWCAVVPRPAAPPLGVSKDQFAALERAIRDLTASFGTRYPRGAQYLDRLAELQDVQARLQAASPTAQDEGHKISDQFRALKSEALLSNPLLDFERLLLIQRGQQQLGLPANYDANTEIPRVGYDNQLVALSPVRPEGTLKPVFRPEQGKFVGDVDLHFDGNRMLFSMPGANGRWQVFEMNSDGSNLHELPLIREPDVDNYDACYLPDGRVMFTSTAPFVGVPCVNGSSHVANLYLLDHDNSIRQLTVDQEHDWCPTVANSGRVMYLRWEYTDLPHSNSRILFEMNPDGTSQTAIFKSSSFFPASFFHARPVPGHPSKIVGIATGHHGVARSGRLLVVDPAQGSREADGVVQEIPGWGKKVAPIIRDTLADGVWPQFLHPYPLSENYFLVSARPTPQVPWGIYLVDVFDNMLLVKELPGYALLESVPFRPTPTPPVIPDKVDPKSSDAFVYLSDIYVGGGLRGIPRGTVKKLRLYTYHYAYRGMGGLLGAVGMDGPWDVKQVLGMVPVEADGSARFRVPANTPIAVQPLDEQGQALQLMRSWFTAMPGETLSCVGCHEQLRDAAPNQRTLAARRAPSTIEPWYGPVRGFAFAREVQPVLDRYCVGCHDGQPRDGQPALCNLRGDQRIKDWWSAFAGNVGAPVGGNFSVAYASLHRFVRRPGIESDIHLLAPMEFHAESTELIQMLRKGHGNVNLDAESWDRLITWIDLDAPFHGTWTEIVGEKRVQAMAQRRHEMSRRYANVDVDPESIPPVAKLAAKSSAPTSLTPVLADAPRAEGWPFDRAEAARRQVQAGTDTRQSLPLADGISLDFVLVPAGEFVMGDPQGAADERPLTRVRIPKPFWMSRTEISNEQFAQFDSHHDSHFEPMHAYQFGIHGFPVNQPQQPAVRLSWQESMAFCDWLSARCGRRLTLPTEAQWEYACRAGTSSPFWYGGLDTDFSHLANLGDAQLRGYALETYIHVRPIAQPSPYDDWVPKDKRFNDGAFVSRTVGGYAPNPWGLIDMHGNVSEWTRTTFRPYPYTEDDGRSDRSNPGPKVVRGGSWYDRPQRGRSAFRLAYQPYQPAFNVGFRVVMETAPSATQTAAQSR